ncbi:MAG: DNA polymerase I [Oscillospiraceae bacterium]|nr:DNA polymerase I [Oscillospiraceae bacterium]
MSRELARIDINAPLDADFSKLRIQPPDTSGLRKFYERLAFRKLLQKLPRTDEPTAPAPSAFTFPEVSIIDTPEALNGLCRVLDTADTVSFAVSPDMAAAGFYRGGKAYAVECSGAAAEALEPFWRSETPKAGCHVKAALRHIHINNIIMDVALAAYLLDPSHGQYAIESIASGDLGAEISSDAQESMLGIMPPGALKKLGRQAAAIGALTAVYTERLGGGGMRLLTDIELPLCRTLARMECNGFKLDTAALAAFGVRLAHRIEELSQAIYSLAGRQFNIQSPKQLGEVLFVQLQLPTYKKTKTGFSVDAEVLGRLAGRHEIIEPVLEYRELCKLKSTYVDGLLSLCGPDGRVRTTFQMTATSTGRLSSSEPNLQNIPIRRSLGAELRRMFIPSRDDWVLIDADYSQIELRVLAHIAGDETMREAFRGGADIHTVTASQVFHVPPDEVTPAMRRSAKAVNFGIVFGISDFSLAEDIGVTRAEARRYIDGYLGLFHGVRQYMADVVARAKTDGYVTTLLGRRRYLPELSASNHNIRAFGERAALNTPIQGTAADIIKLAMIALDKRLQAEGLEARLILQVHDELIVECPRQEAERVRAIVSEEMENVYPLEPPLAVNAGVGRNWFDTK